MKQTVSAHRSATAANPARRSDVPGFVDRIVRPLTRVLNPLIIRFAGGRSFPMFSVLHHRGRSSGRVYATPISAMPRGEFFWLGLTFGEEAAWARNIRAANECVVRYRGVDYQLVEPMVLDTRTVKSELPPVMRFGLSMLGVHKVLRMRPVTRA